MTELPLSEYQQAILLFVRTGRGNGVIRATAGSGKTTTLVEVARALEPGVQACFLAFGRDAAAELARRLPPGVPAMTVHRVGRSTLARACHAAGRRLPPVDEHKYRRLADATLSELSTHGILSDEGTREAREYLHGLLVHARLGLIEPGDEAALRRLGDRHLLVPPLASQERSSIHAALWQVLQAGVNEWTTGATHDFTDMLYLPLRLGLAPPEFDFVCVDEAQDYSRLALEFTVRLAKPRGGRLLFVGDPRQSIFGFAGADSAAIARIRRRTRAIMLPLSISYRCPRRHVELARIISPEIEARPGAPAGKVRWVGERHLDRWARPGDLILARANAPLLQACLSLAAQGRPAFMLGADLAGRLVGLAAAAVPPLRGGRGLPASRFLRDLGRYERSEEARLRRLLGGTVSAATVLAQRKDLLTALRVLLRNESPRREVDLDWLSRRLDGLFLPSPGAVVLSTVHRAKGREADRVLILHPDRMPGPYARSENGLAGEECVQFVALTRARSELIFVVAGDPGEEPGRATAADGSDPAGGRWEQVLRRAWRLARERGASGSAVVQARPYSSPGLPRSDLNASLQGSDLPAPAISPRSLLVRSSGNRSG